MSTDLESRLKFDRDGAGLITRLYCTFPNCKFERRPGSGNLQKDETGWRWTIREHAKQHAPGRAPDLRDIEYVLDNDVYCTVCPKGEGDVGITECGGTRVPDGLECFTCGTTWNADGDNGVLGKEAIASDTTYVSPDQLTLDLQAE